MKQFLSTVWRGMLMGLAEVVPGVSGGTIALLTGIYPRLIGALASFGPQSLGLLGQPRAFFAQHDILFLLMLGVGMGLGVLSFASLMDFLLATYAPPVWGFFSGVILLTAITIGGRLANPSRWWLIGIGLVAGTSMAFLPIQQTEPTMAVFFFAGAIAICAWILPAVSGSYLLLVLGLYPAVMSAISSLQLDVLVVFAAGCALGLSAFVRLLRFLLDKHHDVLMSVLVGFMLGSLINLWPWQLPEAANRLQAIQWPQQYGAEPMLLMVLICFALGGLAVWMLQRYAATQPAVVTQSP